MNPIYLKDFENVNRSSKRADRNRCSLLEQELLPNVHLETKTSIRIQNSLLNKSSIRQNIEIGVPALI